MICGNQINDDARFWARWITSNARNKRQHPKHQQRKHQRSPRALAHITLDAFLVRMFDRASGNTRIAFAVRRIRRANVSTGDANNDTARFMKSIRNANRKIYAHGSFNYV